MKPVCLRVYLAVLFGVVVSLPGTPVRAGSHLWRINEVFSNADGTVQFIELKECCGSTIEIFLTGKLFTSNNKIFTFPGQLVQPTDHKYLLLATAAFAALPGAPTPDYILQSSFFSVNGDTLSYSPAQGYDTFTFGEGALPTNGVNSINITNYATHIFTTGPNSPTNYAGQSGSVNAAGCTNDAECDDGNLCTADSCNNGPCVQTPLTGTPCLDEGNPCTDDLCDNGACTHLPNSNSCDDGNPCTMADHCEGPPSTACTGADINSLNCPPDCPLDPGGVPYECVDGFCTCAWSVTDELIRIVWTPAKSCASGANIHLACAADADCPPGTAGSCVAWPNTNFLATTRSLRFTVTGPGTPTSQDAIKVTMVDLMHPKPRNIPERPPPDFTTFDTRLNGVCSGGQYNGHHCETTVDCFGTVDGTCSGLTACTAAGEANGCARWVGKPGTFYETQTPQSGPYRAARLQCTPFYWDWITETVTGPITVVGAEIVPSSEYSVQAYGMWCMGAEASCTDVSAPVTMYTRRSGDVDVDYNPPTFNNQPNALDVAAVVNKFKNLVGAPVHARAQLQPNLPELNASISGLDIVAVVEAQKGGAYAFSGPCVCPSTVNCGQSCTDCAGMCVKTCVGGANDGEPCINDNHCPGSTCSAAGTCRDNCGRCN